MNRYLKWAAESPYVKAQYIIYLKSMFNQHMNIHMSIILINKVYIIPVISRIDC